MIIATTWDRVDILKISKDVMTAVLGFEPPPPPLNPMSLSEPGLFEKMLQETGFVNIKQSTSTYPFDFGNDKTFQFFCSCRQLIVVARKIRAYKYLNYSRDIEREPAGINVFSPPASWIGR